MGGKTIENAVWGYQAPLAGAAPIAGYLAFYWERVDAWYEEDEQIFVHPRDPYVRIDVLQSRRAVRALLGGVVLAESRRARFLFETGTRTRYYFPPEDVRRELLEPSAATTRCPYKGLATYWNVRSGDKIFPDLVWSYPEPLAEAGPIKGLLAIYDERMDALEVEGGAGGLRWPSASGRTLIVADGSP